MGHPVIGAGIEPKRVIFSFGWLDVVQELQGLKARHILNRLRRDQSRALIQSIRAVTPENSRIP